MKKIVFVILVVLTIFSQSAYSRGNPVIVAEKNYDYPYKNKYTATIIGSSSLVMDGLTPFERLRVRDYSIDIKEDFKVPPTLWYEDGYRFSLTRQRGKAPLVFLIPGTGAQYNSSTVKKFQQVFSDAGYHVITANSTKTGNFIVNASKYKYPGSLIIDSQDMYRAMEASYEKVKNKIDVSDFYLVGYSLGGGQGAFLSYIDEEKKSFNFKRVYLLNPLVNIKKSALKLDRLLEDNLDGKNAELGDILDEIFLKIAERTRKSAVSLDSEVIYSIFREEELSDEKMKIIIGFAFRLVSINLHYIVDLVNERGLYTEKGSSQTRMTSMWTYFEKINFSSFSDYLDKILIPIIKEKGISHKKVLESFDLRFIDSYLKKTDKIGVVTNLDEIILDEEDFKYLKSTFGERLILFPLGGHCGNMFFQDNVETMIRFLNTGRLTHESGK